ncbi:MAG TPA: hypothetical protein VLS94_00055, partial [Fusibacter sp.]|nr:hypothetical protein [Fusibacter sp.]
MRKKIGTGIIFVFAALLLAVASHSMFMHMIYEDATKQVAYIGDSGFDKTLEDETVELGIFDVLNASPNNS